MRRVHEDERRSQARLITAWIEEAGFTPSRGDASGVDADLVLHVCNASEQPAWDVKAIISASEAYRVSVG